MFIVAGIIATCATSCDNAGKKETSASVTTDTAMAMDNRKDTAMAEPSTPPLDSATMMKNWMAYSTPGPEHKMMASMNGTWSGEVTMYMEAGAPPQVSKATMVNKMIMGGRYQQSNYSGNMMGMPFEGMSLMAYDNAKKKILSTWVDNMGTGIMSMEGTWDSTTHTITMSGKGIDPSAGTAKEHDMREIFRMIDNNNQVMEMYGPDHQGREYKMMEIKLTRK